MDYLKKSKLKRYKTDRKNEWQITNIKKQKQEIKNKKQKIRNKKTKNKK